ncbi:DNA polymerase III subunit delta [Bartonella sp. DGB2]|uniref:DNA polymerase III subunit delta n=1 Tax=Bartonella sp. DGB2 TaxID=3388426 RepID=UPI00398FF17A
MAQKKAHEVETFLARLHPQFPIILTYGPDRGLVLECAEKFASLTGVPLADPFATTRIEASDIEKNPEKLYNESATASLFGGSRLLWIRGAANQKRFIEVLRPLLKTPPPQCFIILEAGDLKKGAGLRAAVENSPHAMALPCFTDDARALDRLIDQVLDRFKLSISLDARKWLRESLGADRLISRSELEKLCLYAQKRGEITISDVEEVISDASAFSQDLILDAVLTANLKYLDHGFTRYAESGAGLSSVLAALLRQFQQLQLIRYQVEIKGKTPFSAVAAARPPIFFRRQKIIERATTLWSLNAITRVLERLQKAVLESRQTPSLSEAITRQALLAVTVMGRPPRSSA